MYTLDHDEDMYQHDSLYDQNEYGKKQNDFLIPRNNPTVKTRMTSQNIHPGIYGKPEAASVKE